MLLSIHVKNFALIDDLEIDLSKGLNAITGETGAGKSIVIDAVNFALGKRMPKDIVRDDAEYAFSELVFSVENEEIKRILNDLNIECEDDLIILNRKVVNGRNTCKVNGETVTTAVLKRLSENLIDIHGQHEHQSLLNKNKHLGILDSWLSEEGKQLKEKVHSKYKLYSELNNELNEALESDKGKEKDLDFARYEIKEISEANLKIGEDEELEIAYRKMSNARKISETIYTVHRMTGYEGDGAGDLVGRAVSALRQIASIDEDAENMLSTLTDIDSILNDFNKAIADYEDSLDFSDEDFRYTEARLDLINTLKKKYGNTIEDILSYLEKREADIEKYGDFDSYIENLKIKVEKERKELIELCRLLSAMRIKKAEELSNNIRETLEYLNFQQSKFEISVVASEDNIKSTGYDDVEMLISTNPGERLKPLSEVASGGEVSRIMLAIKSAIADKDNIPTLIFDEIDTGISGRTAQKVSEKIAVISREHQVLLVTHLPQIASMADTHFEISKTVTDGRTVTNVRELSEDDRITELARILSGAEVTEAVISSAKEMKELADKVKAGLKQ